MALKSVIDRFNKVKETISEEKTKKKVDYTNDLVFKPTAVKGEEKTKFKVRFLDVAESPTGKPWVQINYHMFERKGDNRYIKVIDPQTFDKSAVNPISEMARKLFESDNPLDKAEAKKLYRKPRYFTLVYVKEAPENQQHFVGKVLAFEAGTQIFNKIDSAINDDEMCFWDPYKGRDFVLILKTKGEDNWPDYTESKWAMNEGPISTDEKVMDYIGEQLDKITIKKAIIEKEGIKNADQLRELMEGGLKKSPVATKNTQPVRELVTGDTVSTSGVDVDFGDADLTETPKQEKKKEVKQEKKKEVAPADDVEFDVQFDEKDFDIDT